MKVHFQPFPGGNNTEIAMYCGRTCECKNVWMNDFKEFTDENKN